MAAVSYRHVEAPYAIDIGGTRAYNAGDPVPYDTADRIGLLAKEPKLKVFDEEDVPSTTGDGQSVRFHDDLPKNPGTESPTPAGAAAATDAEESATDDSKPKRQRSGSGS